MIQKFLSNLFLLLILNLIIKLLWFFGIDRTIQNMAGATEYGLYFSLTGFSIVFSILLDAGITNFNNRAISRNKNRVHYYLSNIIVLKFLLGIVYAIICFFFALIFNYGERQIWLLSIIVGNQFINSLILYFRSNISGLQLFFTDSLLSVLDKLLMIVLCSFLIFDTFNTGFSIEYFILAQTASYIVTLIIVSLVLWHHTRINAISIDLRYYKKILKHSYPFALLVLLMALYNRIDAVMLERILPQGATQAGIYAQAFRIIDAFSMFGVLFAQLLLPIFSKMLKMKEDISELLSIAFYLIFIPTLSLANYCLFNSSTIMSLMYHENSQISASIFPILMYGFVCISLVYIFGTLLTASGNLRLLNYVAIASVAINVILNLILIPLLGVKGAAITSLITQIFALLLQIYLSKKYIHRATLKDMIIKSSLFGTSHFLLMYAASMYIKQGFALIGLVIAFSIILAITFRMVSPASIKRILSKSNS